MKTATRHPDPKAAMIEAATTLFRRRGYEGVGVAELLSHSGAPRGSLYFHFPGGKEQIAIEAVTRAGEAVRDGIRARSEITTSVEHSSRPPSRAGRQISRRPTTKTAASLRWSVWKPRPLLPR
ncbi:MAG: helix-turn-helix domain-containing protein [Alphaproteobacteria bacterium]|nr:helix-turn-helix domain-containing protein [Alphaproteobacteria bacterium]